MTNTTGADSWEKRIQSGQDILVENKVFSEDVDFCSVLEPNLIGKGSYLVKTSSSVTFRNCTFKGSVLGFKENGTESIVLASFLSNLSFINCTFEEPVSFKGTRVAGRCDFSECVFKKEANFQDVRFGHNSYFNGAYFQGEAKFQNAWFNGRAQFLDAKFRANTSFQQVVFQGEAQFSKLDCTKYLDFSLADFRQNAFFNYAEIRDRATFNNARFWGQVDFVSTNQHSTTFEQTIFWERTRFLKSTFEKKLKLESATFHGGEPEGY